MSVESAIPVIFCLDAEPDPRRAVPDRPVPWAGFEQAIPFFDRLRARLSEFSGQQAHYSWYFRLDPQVEATYGAAQWPLEQYADAVEEFVFSGDEIGVHPHAFRWNPKIKAWDGDYGDADWVDHCIRTCFDAYKDFFGMPSRSIRMGDRWISNRALRLAESLGAHYDLTPEPGYPLQPASIMWDIAREKFTDDLPDFRKVAHAPYRPSDDDFQKSDPLKKEGLWIIPVSTGTITPQAGRLERVWRNVFQPGYLEPWNATLNVNKRPDHFKTMLDQWLQTADYVAPVMRSDVFILKNDFENFKQNLETLLAHPKAGRFVFCTPQEAMGMMGYEERVHA